MEKISETSNQTNQDDHGKNEEDVGARLRAAREQAGLSLADVAERLKLSLRQLDAIEENQFEMLHGAPFVRGFVRNYARFLGMDPAPLLSLLDRRFPSMVMEIKSQAYPSHEPTVIKGERGGKRSGKRIVFYLLGVVLLGAGGYGVFLWNQPDHESVQPTLAISALTEPLSNKIEAASEPASLTNNRDLTLTSNEAASDLVVEKIDSVSMAHRAVNVPSHSASAVSAVPKTLASAATVAHLAGIATTDTPSNRSIKVSASELAWVSITDASGQRLVYSHIKPGNGREVTGVPPFKVVVGNAEYVTLYYHDKLVDLKKATHNATAKIELK